MHQLDFKGYVKNVPLQGLSRVEQSVQVTPFRANTNTAISVKQTLCLTQANLSTCQPSKRASRCGWQSECLTTFVCPLLDERMF